MQQKLTYLIEGLLFTATICSIMLVLYVMMAMSDMH